MKNIRPLNTNWRIFALLFVACSMLFLPGCRNPMEPHNIAERGTGKGTLLLDIGGQGAGRTIRPEISLADFYSFSLAFVARDADIPNVYDTWTVGSGEIGLVPGIWDLHISAYRLEYGWPYPRLAASGRRLGIEVPLEGTVAAYIVLSPIRGGSGTFNWGNISFPGSTITATMEITCVDENDENGVPFSETFYLKGGTETPPPSVPLYAGQYRVIFTLYGAYDERMVVSAILHIYQNMESILPVGFIPSGFPSSLLNLVLASWNGFYWDFAVNGITPVYFDLLGIKGIDDNFADIVGRFNNLSSPATIPDDLEGLKALTDAALVGIGMARADFLYAGNHDTRVDAEAAVAALAVNQTTVTPEWIYGDTLRARVGVYAPSEAEFTDSILMVVPGYNLVGRLDWVRANALTRGLYLVESGNTPLAPQFLSFYPDRNDVTVILRGDGPMRTVSLSGSGSLFWVGEGATLVLDDNITLQGRLDNNHPLVVVSYGGSLIMNAGSRIVGNINTNTDPEGWPRGAGVKVFGGGAFTMNGGEIYNNHATVWPGGGGVVVSGSRYVDADTRFTMNDGTITGNTTEWQGGGVAIYHGTFDMYGGTISGNTSYSGGGGVFAVYNGTFAMHGGIISNNTTAGWGGGGVSLRGENSSFIMSAGAIISGNTSENGGGVHVGQNGTFDMYGGTISDNISEDNGGGVFVANNGTFAMNSGIISSNTTAGWGGGGVAVIGENSSFAMNAGAIISGNTSENNAGGVYVGWNGTFVMHGGIISDNNATGWEGGGVTVRGEDTSFTMHGGEISGHTAMGGGGAVNVDNHGTFTMYGGNITRNTADTGGGVHVNWNGSSTFVMNAGTISNNTAIGWPGGGGVTIRGGNDRNASFTMNGGEISGNTSLPIAGGVSIDNGAFTMHGGAISGNAANPNADDWSSGGGVRVASSTFTMYGGEISDNIAATIPGGWTSGGGLTVTTTSTFTMRGGTISDNEASAGAGVRVDGSSTFTMHNGEIFENTASQNGGAVNVGADSTFTMQNGEIFGNTALQGGGAVNVGPGSTFAMHGGEIFDNTARTAGAVNVWIGTFYMHNGTISGNTAEQFGGGVVVDGDLEAGNPGWFTLNAGTISGNTATVFSGGGVHVGWNGIFDMRGGRIVGNEVIADEAPPPDENGDTSNGDGLPPVWGGGGVANGNIFNMHGGEISGNTAQYGGGVLNLGGTGNNQGIFRISNGIIHGIDAGQIPRNTARAGGAALFNRHVAERGTFAADAFTWLGDLDTTNYTIHAVNGVVLPSHVEGFTISFADFYTMREIVGPTIYLRGDPQQAARNITVTNPEQYDSIMWFFGGTRITGDSISGSRGETLALGPRIHGNLLGIGEHVLTVEVRRNGVPYSQRITFTVAR